MKKGTLIAKAGQGLSAPVFSSVAGTVKGVVSHITLAGKKRDHILIENDFSEEEERLPALSSFDRESVLGRIAEAGVVGMAARRSPPLPNSISGRETPIISSSTARSASRILPATSAS